MGIHTHEYVFICYLLSLLAHGICIVRHDLHGVEHWIVFRIGLGSPMQYANQRFPFGLWIVCKGILNRTLFPILLCVSDAIALVIKYHSGTHSKRGLEDLSEIDVSK
jgi:hypothetical protein